MNAPAAAPAPRARRRGEGGFTMVEVLVSVAIFALAFMGVMAMMLTSVGANASARDMTSATHLSDVYAETFVVNARNWTSVANTATEFPGLGVAQNQWVAINALPVDSEDRPASALNANLAGRAIYCLAYQWTLTEQTGDSGEAQITVRVAWGRGGYVPADCAAATVTTELAASNMSATLMPVAVRTTTR